MIKEKDVLIKINIRNISYYKSVGYDVSITSMNDIVTLLVPIERVNKNSKEKITAVCDICGSENKIMISKYWINYERGGYNFYSCFKCKNVKKEMTSISKWGVSSFSKTEEFKEKFKESSISNYGVDNPNKSKLVRDKIKRTNKEKYGVESYFQLDELREQNKKWMSSDEFKEKSKKTLLQKYGVDSFSKTKEFKEIISSKKELIMNKIKKTFLEKYGVEFYFQTQKFKDNIDKFKRETIRKETCLNKYGVDNVSKSNDIYEKIINSKIQSGLIVPDFMLSDWNIYKRKVRKETNKYKKILYENWDGVDYYDNELIKGYLSYNHTHRFYPTIDHKISVYFGFINNISVEEIGNIENLCITKRYINSMKNMLIEEEFIKYKL